MSERAKTSSVPKQTPSWNGKSAKGVSSRWRKPSVDWLVRVQ